MPSTANGKSYVLTPTAPIQPPISIVQITEQNVNDALMKDVQNNLKREVCVVLMDLKRSHAMKLGVQMMQRKEDFVQDMVLMFHIRIASLRGVRVEQKREEFARVMVQLWYARSINEAANRL